MRTLSTILTYLLILLRHYGIAIIYSLEHLMFRKYTYARIYMCTYMCVCKRAFPNVCYKKNEKIAIKCLQIIITISVIIILVRVSWYQQGIKFMPLVPILWLSTHSANESPVFCRTISVCRLPSCWSVTVNNKSSVLPFPLVSARYIRKNSSHSW